MALHPEAAIPSGRPLLTLGEILEDLAVAPLPDPTAEADGREGGVMTRGKSSTAGVLPPGSSSTHPSYSNHGVSLYGLFEASYNKLSVLLAQPDNSWVDQARQLFQALEVAIFLRSDADSRLTALGQRVTELQKIVRRGQDSIARLCEVVDQEDKACSALG